MMDKKDLKNNLVGNALDFLKRAIEEFEQYPKYCIFRLIRTVNPDLSGHGTGNIRTVIRRHPDTCRAI